MPRRSSAGPDLVRVDPTLDARTEVAEDDEDAAGLAPTAPVAATSSNSHRTAGPWVAPIAVDLAAIRRMVLIAWGVATAAVVLSCGYRVARFRRHLSGALSPPVWFEEEARLVRKAVVNTLGAAGTPPRAILDLGGGSL